MTNLHVIYLLSIRLSFFSIPLSCNCGIMKTGPIRSIIRRELCSQKLFVTSPSPSPYKTSDYLLRRYPVITHYYTAEVSVSSLSHAFFNLNSIGYVESTYSYSCHEFCLKAYIAPWSRTHQITTISLSQTWLCCWLNLCTGNLIIKGYNEYKICLKFEGMITTQKQEFCYYSNIKAITKQTWSFCSVLYFWSLL